MVCKVHNLFLYTGICNLYIYNYKILHPIVCIYEIKMMLLLAMLFFIQLLPLFVFLPVTKSSEHDSTDDLIFPTLANPSLITLLRYAHVLCRKYITKIT